MTKGTYKVKSKEQDCSLKSFIFYYNNKYLIYKDAKYSVGYQPQKPGLDRIKGTIEDNNKLNKLYALPIDLMVTANQRLAEEILSKEYLA